MARRIIYWMDDREREREDERKQLRSTPYRRARWRRSDRQVPAVSTKAGRAFVFLLLQSFCYRITTLTPWCRCRPARSPTSMLLKRLTSQLPEHLHPLLPQLGAFFFHFDDTPPPTTSLISRRRWNQNHREPPVHPPLPPPRSYPPRSISGRAPRDLPRPYGSSRGVGG